MSRNLFASRFSGRADESRPPERPGLKWRAGRVGGGWRPVRGQAARRVEAYFECRKASRRGAGGSRRPPTGRRKSGVATGSGAATPAGEQAHAAGDEQAQRRRLRHDGGQVGDEHVVAGVGAERVVERAHAAAGAVGGAAGIGRRVGVAVGVEEVGAAADGDVEAVGHVRGQQHGGVERQRQEPAGPVRASAGRVGAEGVGDAGGRRRRLGGQDGQRRGGIGIKRPGHADVDRGTASSGGSSRRAGGGGKRHRTAAAAC